MGSCPINWPGILLELLPFFSLIICGALITSSYFLLIGPRLLLLGSGGALWLSIRGAPWLGFILFLIYVGGILVLFTYFLSLSQDKPISNIYYIIPLVVLLAFVVPYSGVLLSFRSSFIVVNNAATNCYLLSGLWLFFAIVVVVKLTLPSIGPLRVTQW